MRGYFVPSQYDCSTDSDINRFSFSERAFQPSRRNSVAVPDGNLAKAIDDSLYGIDAVQDGFRADNQAQKLAERFVGGSTRVATQSGTLEL
jgi:hypothetical protein